jgi:polar amino acid transport system ATP-binding protein
MKDANMQYYKMSETTFENIEKIVDKCEKISMSGWRDMIKNVDLTTYCAVLAYQNVPEEIKKNAKDILERVGLSDKLTNYPCQLSGGQKQRVSIARALALKPRILFFDEPTSALDPELTGEILKVIKQLASENVTMVIVTHEIEFAKNVSDKIIFMADGVICEMGTPEEVIDNPKSERTKMFLNKSLENI